MLYIKEINISKGIGGLLNTFKEISEASGSITFIGTPGFCTPFAELLSFVIRGSDKKLVFIPNTAVDKARSIISTPEGMQLGEPADPAADTVILLGGLAIPKMNTDVNEIKKIIDDITDPDNRTIIGVFFMSIFQEMGWTEVIDFDYLLDSHMNNTTLKK